MIAKHISRRGKTKSVAKLAKYIMVAEGGLNPRDWKLTADYITDHKISNSEKVRSIRVTNCETDDPVLATKLIMATQDHNTRSKADKTYHLVLSFPTGEEPDQQTLNKIEDEFCDALGFSHHQRISAVHQDTDNLHIHIAINQIDPVTFKNRNVFRDQKILMETCEAVERKYNLTKTDHGLVQNGVENDRQNERYDRIPDRDLTNTAFRRYLYESVNREIESGEQTGAGNSLSTLSVSILAHDVATYSSLLQSDERDDDNRQGAKSVHELRRPLDGLGEPERKITFEFERKSGIKAIKNFIAEQKIDLLAASNWHDLAEKLAKAGLTIKKRGAGLVIGDEQLNLWTKVSDCNRLWSFDKLEKHYGPFQSTVTQPVSNPDLAYGQNSAEKKQLFNQYLNQRQNFKNDNDAFYRKRKINIDQYKATLNVWYKQQSAALRSQPRAMRRILRAKLKEQKQAALNDYRQRYRKTTKYFPTWRNWLQVQAQHGNSAALNVLKTLDESEAKWSQNLMTTKASKWADKLFTQLKPRVLRNGDVLYRAPDGGTVIDAGAKIHAQNATTAATLIALKMASEKFAGQALNINGDEQFKTTVAILAARNKLNVKFSDPKLEAIKNNVIKEMTAKPEKDPIAKWIDERNQYNKNDKTFKMFDVKMPATTFNYYGRRKVADQYVLLVDDGQNILTKEITPNEYIRLKFYQKGEKVEINNGKFKRIHEKNKTQDQENEL